MSTPSAAATIGSRVSVVVPTYKRPDELTRCLDGLGRQDQPPLEIIVVHRDDDASTLETLARRGSLLRTVGVTTPGVVAAMAAGATASSGEIIAFLDDDTVPPPPWLASLERPFADPRVGAVGGRDVIAGQERPLAERVGQITRWGKLIGNHHQGRGPAREVDVLKGANMAFRRQALALPIGLRGMGAQAHYEVASCLRAQRYGWILIYDPSSWVSHEPGQRFDADRRGRPEPRAVSDAAYNYVLCLLSQRPSLFARRAIFGVLIGDRGIPGLLRAAAARLRGEPDVAWRLLPALKGQLAALVAFRRGRRVRMCDTEGGLSV